MSGCGDTWFSRKYNAIGFEPETDKDIDRLEELLEEIREGGYGHRIIKRTFGVVAGRSIWFIALEDLGSNEH